MHSEDMLFESFAGLGLHFPLSHCYVKIERMAHKVTNEMRKESRLTRSKFSEKCNAPYETAIV